MRILVGLGFVLVVTAANAQSTTTTVNPAPPAGSGAAHSAVTKQMMEHTHATSATTVTKAGSVQPMGADGNKPMGADGSKPAAQ